MPRWTIVNFGKKNGRFEQLAWALIAVNCLMIALLGYFLFKPPRAVTAGSLLAETIAQLQDRGVYALQIREKSDDYSLEFEGYALDGDRLFGRLSAYNIEVFRQAEKLYVKTEDGAWEAADQHSLDGLQYFLRTPWEIISRADPANAHFGPDESIDGTVHKTLLLTGNAPQTVPALFPQHEGLAVREIDICLWVKDEDLALKRMALLIAVELPGLSAKQVTRSFLLTPRPSGFNTADHRGCLTTTLRRSFPGVEQSFSKVAGKGQQLAY